MTFKSDLTDDLDIFFDNSEFAIDILYNAATIQGIFDNEFFEVVEGSIGVETTIPRVLVKSSDVVGAAHDETMTINSIDYNIVGVQPDGTGLTLIILSVD